MYFRQIDLTAALRPALLPEEAVLFVQDAVGLYEGKYKIPEYQNGHAYLTTHRICYVDNVEPRKRAVAIDLKDVDRPEFYAGFLKSSPKITLYPKPSKRSSLSLRQSPYSPSPGGTSSTPPTRTASPFRPLPPAPASVVPSNATWICPICSFSNPVPSNFDPATANANTPLPPCLACGIKPPLLHVVKAALAAMTNRQSDGPAWSQSANQVDPTSAHLGALSLDSSSGTGETRVACSRCTYLNHPDLTTCEICGAPLRRNSPAVVSIAPGRPESPAPLLQGSISDEIHESVKFSFRAGGGQMFYDNLKSALIQRKWLLQSAPPPPKPNRLSALIADGSPSPSPDPSRATPQGVGIAGLERRGLQLQKNNELVIGSAFSDLEALMTSAKEIIALAESFSRQANLDSNGSTDSDALLSQSASTLGLVVTKDMLGSGANSEAVYISELSRNLAEYLTDDARGILKREGGIMTLVDLWAVFNRARGGVELVSPGDFEKAAGMWDKLKLPVRLRRFKSGLLVVQGRDRTDEKTIAALLGWLKELHHQQEVGRGVTWDVGLYGMGVTAQEAAERFGWSVGVAAEELEMAEERGALCREQGSDGLRFWENWFLQQEG